MKMITIKEGGKVVFARRNDGIYAGYYEIIPTPSSRNRLSNLFNANIEDTQLTSHGKYFSYCLFWYDFKHQKEDNPDAVLTTGDHYGEPLEADWMTEAIEREADAKDLMNTQEWAK